MGEWGRYVGFGLLVDSHLDSRDGQEAHDLIRAVYLCTWVISYPTCRRNPLLAANKLVFSKNQAIVRDLQFLHGGGREGEIRSDVTFHTMP